MQDQPDSPGVAIFPPLLMGLALLAVGVLHWLWPLPISTRPVALAFGIVLSILGVGLAAWGHRTLVKGGTNVSPLKPTTAIVIAGPFRFTRNPLYAGVMTLLLGLSLAIGTWWGFVVIVPVLFILHHGVILREERYLERKFGESYVRYKSMVRRYL
jgi:protein-S-isoprenylcysteine O-methyltransferase Ste14